MKLIVWLSLTYLQFNLSYVLERRDSIGLSPELVSGLQTQFAELVKIQAEEAIKLVQQQKKTGDNEKDLNNLLGAMNLLADKLSQQALSSLNGESPMVRTTDQDPTTKPDLDKVKPDKPNSPSDTETKPNSDTSHPDKITTPGDPNLTSEATTSSPGSKSKLDPDTPVVAPELEAMGEKIKAKNEGDDTKQSPVDSDHRVKDANPTNNPNSEIIDSDRSAKLTDPTTNSSDRVTDNPDRPAKVTGLAGNPRREAASQSDIQPAKITDPEDDPDEIRESS